MQHNCPEIAYLHCTVYHTVVSMCVYNIVTKDMVLLNVSYRPFTCILDTVCSCLSQHSTAQHSTAQHSTAQHSTAQHSTYLIHIRGFVFLQSLSGAHPLTVLGCGVLPGCSSCLQHHHEPMFVYAVGPGSFLFDLRVDILGNRLVCGKIEHLNTITENILNV